VQSMNIPSATLKRELYTEVATATLPNLDEKTRKAIRDEIQTGVTDEDIALMGDADRATHEATIKNTEMIGKEPQGGFA
jgi:hypothetical protein